MKLQNKLFIRLVALFFSVLLIGSLIQLILFAYMIPGFGTALFFSEASLRWPAIIAFIFVIDVSIFLIFSFLVYRLLTRSLSPLRELVGKLSPGSDGKASRGQLLMNTIIDPEWLTGQINKYITEIHNANLEITRRYKERTAELDHANEKLIRYTGKLEELVSKRMAELREKDLELIQSGKLVNLGEMATGIAHEINQPIHIIKLIVSGLLRMGLRQQNIDQAYLTEELNTINKQIVRTQKIIEHMKAFSRKRGLKMELVQINKSVMDVFLLIGQQLKNHEIFTDLRLQPDLPLIYADATQMEQIIINLVINARDALDEMEISRPAVNGEISEKRLLIESRVGESKAIVEVSDNGIGISEANLDKIFEPFFTTKLARKGTGLGLSITYNLVRGMNGDISVRSEPQKGTTFAISFPIPSAQV